MSREIKFRAYQKTPSLNHKPGLYEVTGLDFYEGDYGGGEVCLKNKKGEQWTEYIKDVVLEQYTGLKDKNGKEIYGGDIVTTNYMNAIGVVVWDDGAWDISLTNKDFGLFLAEEVGIGVEIIGNIHENPELLEGIKNGE